MFAFSRRKNLWDTIIHMIAHGLTSDTAINRIYLVYGWGKSVCTICNALAKDRRDKIDRLLEFLAVCFLGQGEAIRRMVGGLLILELTTVNTGL